MALLFLFILSTTGSCSDSSSKEASCGDGVCQETETATTCPADCSAGTCGDGRCDAGEGAATCPADCAGSACGNGLCEDAEDATSCPADCGTALCGDGVCDQGEDLLSCREDCDDAPSCYVARCEQDFAVTCDGTIQLNCGAYGGACGAYWVEEDQQQFSWCTCGPIGEGKGQCLDQRQMVLCEQGLGVIGVCGAGTFCDVAQDLPEGVACYCDDLADGVCPDPTCTNDVDCQGCVPDCAGKECGSNGCNGQCGTCAMGESCVGGLCQGCTPSCAGRQCGSDGCSGSCGTCPSGETCNTNTGLCESQCVPDCTGRICGYNGCDGSCGSCPQGKECAPDGSFCDCDFFSRLEYTFDGSGVDWSTTNYVAITATHIGLDGAKKSQQQVVLMSDQPSDSLSWAGACEPHIEVTRHYSLSGGHLCDPVSETVQATTITVPSATHVQGSTCTVPSL